MDEQNEQEKQKTEKAEPITAKDIAAQLKDGGSFEPPAAKPAEPPPADDPEDVSDEEADKQVKEFQEGKEDVHLSKKATKRLFELQEKKQDILKSEFNSKIKEHEKLLKKSSLSALEQKRYGLAAEYKRRFVDVPEKSSKDFESDAKYNEYIKDRELWRQGFEESFAKVNEEIKAMQAEAAAESAGSGAEFQFKTTESLERYKTLQAAYIKAVPESADVLKRWAELPKAVLEFATESPYAPALLHAALSAKDFAKNPEREQLKTLFMFEQELIEKFSKGAESEDAKSKDEPPPQDSKTPAPPPKPNLPPPPPKMKGGSVPPKAAEITAKDLRSKILAGEI